MDIERITETFKPQQRARLRVASADLFSAILDTEVAKTNQDLQRRDTQPEQEYDNVSEEFDPQVLVGLMQTDYQKVPENKNDTDVVLSTAVHDQPAAQQVVASTTSPTTGAVPGPLQQIVLQTVEGEAIAPGLLLKELHGLLAKRTVSTPVMSFDQLYENLVREMVSKKTGALRLRLEPKDLGTIEVYFTLDKNALSIAFAANEQTKKLLQESQDELMAFLHQQSDYAQTTLRFASYDTQEHRSFDQKFGDTEQKNEYEMLNITSKEDILSGIQTLFSDMVVNYVA